MKFRTQWTGKKYGNPERFTKPSLTVPDQSMSVVEINRRFTRGLAIGANVHQGIYDGDEFVPDPNRLDLAEREAIIKEYESQQKDTEKRRVEWNDNMKKERHKQQVISDHVRQQQEKEQNNNPKKTPPEANEK